jgi:hypothetical protein
MQEQSFPRSWLLIRLVMFPLVCVFCLPGGAVLVEMIRRAVGVRIPWPIGAGALCVAAIALAACLVASWTSLRSLGWAIVFMGHAALANALVPDRSADWQLIWLGAGVVLGALVGLLAGSSRERGQAATELTEGPVPGPAANRAGRLHPGRRAVVAGVLAVVVVALAAFAVRYGVCVATQARIAEAVARCDGHTIYDHPGTPTLLFEWLDLFPRADECYCLRSVELGSRAGNEELAELTEIGLAKLPHLRELRLRHSRVTDDGLTTVAPLVVLERISVGRATTDAGLTCLDGLPALHFLDLSSSRITGEGLRSACHFPALSCLNLQDTQITGDDLAHLKVFPQLISLDLSATPITDSGLAHLTELPNLSSLILIQTRITDAGLKHLTQVPQLRWLFLTGSRVTQAGRAEFHRARPGVWTD